jgi:hypothetical protein
VFYRVLYICLPLFIFLASFYNRFMSFDAVFLFAFLASFVRILCVLLDFFVFPVTFLFMSRLFYCEISSTDNFLVLPDLLHLVFVTHTGGSFSRQNESSKQKDESQQIAAWQLLYRVQHPAWYVSRLQTIPSLDAEL